MIYKNACFPDKKVTNIVNAYPSRSILNAYPSRSMLIDAGLLQSVPNMSAGEEAA